MLFSNVHPSVGIRHTTCDAGAHARNAHRAHWAHAAVVGVHSLCCGVPILAAMLASGAGLGLLGGLTLVHDMIHHYEVWIVAMSGLLVAAGGVFEWRLRRSGVRRTPWLFLLSAAAFFVNATVVALHTNSLADHHHAVHDHGHDHTAVASSIVRESPPGGVTDSAISAATPTTVVDDSAQSDDHDHAGHHHP